MIQRIQTLFLLLAAFSFGALFIFPFATSTVASAHYLSDSAYDIRDNVILLTLTIFLIGIVMLAIFLFKNRKLQRKLVYLVIFLAIAMSVTSYVLLKMDAGNTLQSAGVHVQPGTILPVLGILFSFLAGYYIGKDEKLVKSMDRLR
jgi:hypothetical protein